LEDFSTKVYMIAICLGMIAIGLRGHIAKIMLVYLPKSLIIAILSLLLLDFELLVF